MKLLLIICCCLLASCKLNRDQQIDNYLNILEHQIHYKVEGQGPPVLFAHSGYLNLDMWDAQVAALKKDYTTIRFSDLGHGLTTAAQPPIYGHEIISGLSEITSDQYGKS